MSIKKRIIIILCALLLVIVYLFSTIKYRNSELEILLVQEIVTTIRKELYKNEPIQTEYYLLRREPWEINIGNFTIIEGSYFSAWKYIAGDIERIKKSDWDLELSRDNQVVWEFFARPMPERREEICVGLTGILPSDLSVDGKQRRVGYTSWVLDVSSDNGSLERSQICETYVQMFDFSFIH